MKTPETITLTVESDGSIRVAVAGVAGPSCTALTAALLAELGDVTASAKTPEYRQHAVGTVATHAVRQS